MSDSAALLARLNEGVDQLGLDLPDSVQLAMIQYIELMARWNKAYNLTAIRDIRDMVALHLLDSLAVLPFVGSGSITDVGSGAGLPGIPIALARPEQSLVLIDSNGKKTRFINQAKIDLKLNNIDVINGRVEDYQPEIYFDTVIARAYADTAKIIQSTRHLHSEKTHILVMQGKLNTELEMPEYEIKQAHTLKVPYVDADRHLLDIVKINS